ncbi:hypothetical protein R1flu_002141 [Riccia fluitans]|uniref:Uncharacterized protein n=1 Tax=Riccia fluitans TaxID=41844 RepID=A0ABD1Y589_9MARC
MDPEPYHGAVLTTHAEHAKGRGLPGSSEVLLCKEHGHFLEPYSALSTRKHDGSHSSVKRRTPRRVFILVETTRRCGDQTNEGSSKTFAWRGWVSGRNNGQRSSVSSGTALVVHIVLSARPKSLLLSYRNSGLLEYHLPLQNEAPKIGLLVVDTDTNVTSWTTSRGDFSQRSPADYGPHVTQAVSLRSPQVHPLRGIYLLSTKCSLVVLLDTAFGVALQWRPVRRDAHIECCRSRVLSRLGCIRDQPSSCSRSPPRGQCNPAAIARGRKKRKGKRSPSKAISQVVEGSVTGRSIMPKPKRGTSKTVTAMLLGGSLIGGN